MSLINEENAIPFLLFPHLDNGGILLMTKLDNCNMRQIERFSFINGFIGVACNPYNESVDAERKGIIVDSTARNPNYPDNIDNNSLF